MRVKITITGNVHDVGYRVFLLNQADSLLIERFDARNVHIGDKQALVVLVEGDDEQVKEFIEFVKTNKPEKAVVEEIKVEDYKKPIRSINSYRSSIMIEQLNKIIQVGLNMLEKQDEMLQKQDETIRVIREEGGKTRDCLGRKIDNVAEKVDTVSEKLDKVAEKIDLLRADLKSYMDERFAKIEKEIERIKAKIGLG